LQAAYSQRSDRNKRQHSGKYQCYIPVTYKIYIVFKHI